MWDTSSCTNMESMFLQATSFNSDIRDWDVMRVKDMDYMFYHAESFRHSLCGPAWVLSKASNNLMFDGSDGKITQQYCSQQRDLVQRQPANALTCSKCGKFKKSGRPSCCAPGGAWFKDCGAAGNTKVNYKWTDGANACKPTQPAAVTPPLAPRAPYAAPSRNHAKRVVVVAVVLGTKTVGLLETKRAKSSTTRGSRVSRPANQNRRPRVQPPVIKR